MRRLILSFSLVALVALPSLASAQLAPIPNQKEYLDFLWDQSDKVPGTSYGVNYYVGPYTARFGTSPTRSVTSPMFSVYCVDLLHTAGDQWILSTGIGTGAVDSQMGNTRLGATTGAVATYRAVAYLSSLFGSYTSVDPTKAKAYSIIHSAIWKVTQNQNIGSTTLQGLRNQLLTNHATAMAAYDAQGWYVLSPDRSTGANGQEFLVRTPVSVIPEPSTYLLLGTGLLFLVAFGRKRFGSRADGESAA